VDLSSSQRYEPSGDALYLSVVRQEHALQQGDSTVDDFYAQSSAIWRHLDSLRSAGCRTCPCCQAVQANLEFHRVYEFLSRLRKEFEPRRAQLFARGRISLMEALSEIRAEETRLRGAGLLEVPSVLATRGLLPLHLLHRPLLARVLHRSCPLLLEDQVAPVHIVTTATMMVILSPSATQSGNTCARRDHHPQGLRHLPRQLQPLL
uniref:Uncharacterized protein n=1 Tax=Aegilops tauschii subsp. strangulata TaxID=200361 RepID=A0A453P160_AEGTS